MAHSTKYRSLSISLPEELIAKVDAIAKKNYRSRSDVIRESIVLRVIPSYTPSASEVKMIKQAKAEYVRGQFISWKDLKHELDNPSLSSRK